MLRRRGITSLPTFLGMAIRSIVVETLRKGYHPVKLVTGHGEVECRHYVAPEARRAAVFVGGAGGGWDSPAGGLYPLLCQELLESQIASLRVRYRYPAVLEESVLDVLAGIAFLQSQGIERVAVIGWSFGGAVVIQAGARSAVVRTVVTFATQSHGASVVSQLPIDCSILLLHGTGDGTLPPSCSEHTYRLAHEPKRLLLYEGADHAFSLVADEVRQVVREWLVEEVAPHET